MRARRRILLYSKDKEALGRYAFALGLDPRFRAEVCATRKRLLAMAASAPYDAIVMLVATQQEGYVSDLHALIRVIPPRLPVVFAGKDDLLGELPVQVALCLPSMATLRESLLRVTARKRGPVKREVAA